MVNVIKLDHREIGWWCEVDHTVDLTQDGDRWWAVMNAAMNLRILAPRS
jgi:hypothetical protein